MTKQPIFLFGDYTHNIEKEILSSTQGIKGGNIMRFADGEASIEITTELNKEKIFIVQSVVNDQSLVALLIMIDTAKRYGIKNITAIVTYMGYARQDRKIGTYSPVSAKLTAKMLETAGLDELITLDLHNEVIQSFFDIPVTNLLSTKLFSHKIINNHLDDIVIVAPDIGAVKRSRDLANNIKKNNIVIIDKYRPKPGVSEIMNIIGDVENKHCIITDDIVDSAGTLCNAAQKLKEHGAKFVEAYITHGVFAGKAAGNNNNIAIDRIGKSVLDKLIITNSTNLSQQAIDCQKIEIISMASILSSLLII